MKILRRILPLIALLFLQIHSHAAINRGCDYTIGSTTTANGFADCSAEIANLYGRAPIPTSSPTGTNTYAATSAPAVTTLVDGMSVWFDVPNTNSGASTFNLDALGATALVDASGTAIASGDLISGKRYQFTYKLSAIQWRVMGVLNAGGASAGLPYVTVGSVSGLTSERAITPDGTTITGTDGGANTTYGLSITTNGVSNTQLAQMPTLTIKGNNTGVLANAIDLTVAQLNTMINSTVAPVFANITAKPTTLSGYGIIDGQPLDSDLTALSANSTAGLWASTAVGSGAARTLTAPAAGITITNPAGTAGNPTFVLANDLAAYEGLAANGIVARTATDTAAVRTITGTANEITATNGDGVAGNPTLSIPAAVTFTGKTVTGGTFTTPTITLPGAGITFNGSTSGTTTLAATAAASGALTLPAATDTLIGKATTDALTNKTFNTAAIGNVFQINGTGITAVSGTGSVCLTTNCALTTPALGTPSALVLTNASGLPTTALTGQVTLAQLPTLGANTLLANATAGSAVPTALAVPSCSTSASALNYTTSTGFSCNAAVNAATLNGATMASPGAIGGTVAGSVAATTISATGQITSTLVTGTAPFSVASTTNVANLNASTLNGTTFAAPGTIGGTTPGLITGTTITANTGFVGPHNGTVGATTPNTVAATTISASGQITSTLATGTAPFSITSTTQVPNLYVARAALADTVTTNANLTGPVTSAGNATSVTANAITDTMLRQGTARTVIGRSANTTGNVADVAGAGADTYLSDDGATLAFRAVTNQSQNSALSGDISPAQITVDQNDYNPASLSTASVLRLSTDASRSVTGLQGGSDGRRIIIRNVGGFNIVLADQSISSTAANRFKFGVALTLGGGDSVELNYDSTDSRWYKVADTIQAASGSGEANTISSVGGGTSLVAGKVGVDLQVNSLAGEGLTLAGPTANLVTLKPAMRYVSKTATYTVVAADRGYTIEANTNAFTLNLTAAATLGDGFWFIAKNNNAFGVNALTIDPNAAETIDGVVTSTDYPGAERLVYSDGANWRSHLIQGGTFFTQATTNFIIPNNMNSARVIMQAGGGAGGSGRCDATSTTRNGGTGGGGGGRIERDLALADFGAFGATISAVAGAGGTGGVGVSTAATNGNVGTVGGNSTLALASGTISVFGGGPGVGGTAINGSGGSGGGTVSVGLVGTAASVIGGSPAVTAGANGLSGQGAGTFATSATPFPAAEWGGGGGGAGGIGTSGVGGNSLFAAGGGGGGGPITAGNVGVAGATGGATNKYNTVSGGGGATGGAATGAVGSAATATANSLKSGDGAGGGGSLGAGTTAGTGGAGIRGSGGGGGSSSITGTVSGAGGVGGTGFVAIVYK